MNVPAIFHKVEKLAIDNAPGILTGVGVVGALASAYLSGKASFRASDILAVEKIERLTMNPEPSVSYKEPADIVIPPKDIVKLVWKEYIPAAGVLSLTVTCVIFANRVTTKRAAAMAAAYSLSEKAYSEYREKVTDRITKSKEQQIRDDIAQDRVTANPSNNSQIIITGNGDVMCYDMKSDRYFRSNMEAIRKVENNVNQQVNAIGYATVSDFYAGLKLGGTPYSDDLGWTTDKLLEVQFSGTISENGEPCVAIDYLFQPIRQYTKGCEEDPPF